MQVSSGHRSFADLARSIHFHRPRLRSLPGIFLRHHLLHDADATADDIFKSPAFKEVLTTLRALAANDDRIIEYFRGVSQGQQRKGGGSVQFDIDERLAKRINLADFAREIELKCWDRLAKLSWRPFEEARAFARRLGLRNCYEWQSFCRTATEAISRPPDIPADPQKVFSEKGWKGWGDWLGTGVIATAKRNFRTFEAAKEFVHHLGLKSETEWREYTTGKLQNKASLPLDIPTTPARVYADQGWTGMGDWLGTGTIAPRLRKYRTFLEARDFARSLGLNGSVDWFEFCKGEMPEKGQLPPDIPQSPNKIYTKKGWRGYGDWLGTGRLANHKRKFTSFSEARKYAQGLNLKNRHEWKAFCEGKLPEKGTLPPTIPSNPNRTYKDSGWAGMGDWIGTGRVAAHHIRYRPFQEARKFAHNLRLSNQAEWRDFCRGKLPSKGTLPADIPANPNQTYKDLGWKSLGDWLGTGTIAPRQRNYRPFSLARAFVHSLGLKSRTEWNAYSKGQMPQLGELPTDIPATPDKTYQDKGWAGVGDWLGTGRTRASKSTKRKS